MDQSISFMAEKGTAKNIMFHPLRATQVNLPEGAAFVVADSSVVSEKQVTAATHFNLRVVECRMSALLLAKKEGAKNWKECRTMSKAQTALELSVEQLKEKVEKHLHPGSYSLDELSTEFGMTVSKRIMFALMFEFFSILMFDFHFDLHFDLHFNRCFDPIKTQGN